MDTNLPVFSAKESIKIAWHNTKGAKGTFWIVLFLTMIVSAIPIPTMDSFFLSILAIVLYVSKTILGFLLAWGLIYLGIQRATNQPIQYEMVRYMFNVNL